jgi:hypothetical protein
MGREIAASDVDVAEIGNPLRKMLRNTRLLLGPAARALWWERPDAL